MMVKARAKIGHVSYEFAVENQDEKEAIFLASTLASPRITCNNCDTKGYDSKYVTCNKDKDGNVYVNVKCGKCGARSKLGTLKAKGYFWHDYEVYTPAEKKAEETETEEPDLTDEDLPF